MADAGYDVADYRDIDPPFGTLAEAEALIAEAHALGLRVIVDIVPNHCSDAARVVPGGARGRARLGRAGPVLVPPRPRPGRRAAAERLAVASSAARPGPGSPGRRRSGTCTCSRPSSRTSTGTTRRSARSSRTSCGSGSTAASTASASTRATCWSRTRRCPTRPAAPGRPAPVRGPRRGARDLPGLARGRRLLPRAAVFVAEVWLPDAERLRPVPAPGRAAHRVQLRLPGLPLGRRGAARGRSTSTLAAHAAVGAPATWVLSNHDVHPARHPVRPGRHLVRPRPAPDHRQPGRPRARHPPGPGRRAADPRAARLGLRLPGRGARACRRSRTSRTSCARTRSGTAPATPTAAATAAGCRCRGPGRSRRSASARGRPRLAAPAGAVARAHRRGRVRRPGLDAGALPPRAAHPPRRARPRRAR